MTKEGDRRKAIYTKSFLDSEPQEAQTLNDEASRVIAAVTRCRAADAFRRRPPR